MKNKILDIVGKVESGHLEPEEATNKLFDLCVVSKSVAKQYAEFCVRCDRKGLPLLELDDYIKQYCC